MHSFSYPVLCRYDEDESEYTGRRRYGLWEILHLEPNLEEIRVYVRNYEFNVIIGTASQSRFICVIGENMCYPFNDLHDTSYHRFQLSYQTRLDREDANAIAAVLQSYLS